jgi:antirestriction protein ArdC
MHASDLFEKVTAELVAAIEAGARGFRMPWHRLAAGGLPRSVDGRPYRGWNALVLGLTAADRDWSSSTWATYRGWQRHDAQVRRGERGTHVVLWKPTERATTPDDGEESGSRRSLFARTFTVFAAEQVDGAESYRVAEPERPECERIAEADAYFAAVDANVVHGGNVACYVPSTDTIHLPSLTQFDQPSDYYSTAAHEHVHRTGHESRIGRDLSGRFGDHAYGAEELIAELGAAFWCAQLGLVQATRDDHAKYLGDWLAMLSTDSRAMVAACGHAQRAVDWLNAAAGIVDAPEVGDAECLADAGS